MDTTAIADLLRETAEVVINPRFQTLGDGDIMAKSNPNDLVTVADREAEEYLTTVLRAHFPHAVVIGEETAFADPRLLDALVHADHAFVIDPIDGTQNFVQGRKEHGVMLAEVRQGVTTRGWIWQPQTGRAYVAEKGAGVRLNDQEILRNAKPRKPLGATSKSHLQGFTGDGVLSPVVRTRFACAFDYPRVVHGELDFVNYTKVFPWDHLVGALMVAEIGGTSRTLDGQPYVVGNTYQGLLAAASPHIWETAYSVWPTKPAGDGAVE